MNKCRRGLAHATLSPRYCSPRPATRLLTGRATARDFFLPILVIANPADFCESPRTMLELLELVNSTEAE